MRSFITTLIVCILVTFLSIPAQAALTNIGTGTSIWQGYEKPGDLIYDDIMDVTWYDWQWPANTQVKAAKWARNLEVTFNGIVLDNWRLPTWDEYKSIYDAGVRSGSASDEFESLLGKHFWLASGNEVFDFYNPDNPLTMDPDSIKNALAITTSQVPIPGAVWLLGTGLLGILGIKKKKIK